MIGYRILTIKGKNGISSTRFSPFVFYGVKPPLAELPDPVQDVGRHAVVHPFPDMADEFSPVLPVVLSEKVEPDPEDQLGSPGLTHFREGGSNIDGQYPDGIAPGALVQEIAGIVEVIAIGNTFYLDGVEQEKRDDRQPEKALHELEGIAFPSEGEYSHPLQVVVDPIDFCYMVGPAGWISPEPKQLVEYLADRCVDPNFIDVQNGVLLRVNTDPLHDPLTVIETLFLGVEGDKSRLLGFVNEIIEDVRKDPFAYCRGLQVAFMAGRIRHSFQETIKLPLKKM